MPSQPPPLVECDSLKSTVKSDTRQKSTSTSSAFQHNIVPESLSESNTQTSPTARSLAAGTPRRPNEATKPRHSRAQSGASSSDQMSDSFNVLAWDDTAAGLGAAEYEHHHTDFERTWGTEDIFGTLNIRPEPPLPADGSSAADKRARESRTAELGHVPAPPDASKGKSSALAPWQSRTGKSSATAPSPLETASYGTAAHKPLLNAVCTPGNTSFRAAAGVGRRVRGPLYSFQAVSRMLGVERVPTEESLSPLQVGSDSPLTTVSVHGSNIAMGSNGSSTFLGPDDSSTALFDTDDDSGERLSKYESDSPRTRSDGLRLQSPPRNMHVTTEERGPDIEDLLPFLDATNPEMLLRDTLRVPAAAVSLHSEPALPPELAPKHRGQLNAGELAQQRNRTPPESAGLRDTNSQEHESPLGLLTADVVNEERHWNGSIFSLGDDQSVDAHTPCSLERQNGEPAARNRSPPAAATPDNDPSVMGGATNTTVLHSAAFVEPAALWETWNASPAAVFTAHEVVAVEKTSKSTGRQRGTHTEVAAELSSFSRVEVMEWDYQQYDGASKETDAACSQECQPKSIQGPATERKGTTTRPNPRRSASRTSAKSDQVNTGSFGDWAASELQAAAQGSKGDKPNPPPPLTQARWRKAEEEARPVAGRETRQPLRQGSAPRRGDSAAEKLPKKVPLANESRGKTGNTKAASTTPEPTATGRGATTAAEVSAAEIVAATSMPKKLNALPVDTGRRDDAPLRTGSQWRSATAEPIETALPLVPTAPTSTARLQRPSRPTKRVTAEREEAVQPKESASTKRTCTPRLVLLRESTSVRENTPPSVKVADRERAGAPAGIKSRDVLEALGGGPNYRWKLDEEVLIKYPPDQGGMAVHEHCPRDIHSSTLRHLAAITAQGANCTAFSIHPTAACELFDSTAASSLGPSLNSQVTCPLTWAALLPSFFKYFFECTAKSTGNSSSNESCQGDGQESGQSRSSLRSTRTGCESTGAFGCVLSVCVLKNDLWRDVLAPLDAAVTAETNTGTAAGLMRNDLRSSSSSRSNNNTSGSVRSTEEDGEWNHEELRRVLPTGSPLLGPRLEGAACVPVRCEADAESLIDCAQKSLSPHDISHGCVVVTLLVKRRTANVSAGGGSDALLSSFTMVAASPYTLRETLVSEMAPAMAWHLRQQFRGPRQIGLFLTACSMPPSEITVAREVIRRLRACKTMPPRSGSVSLALEHVNSERRRVNSELDRALADMKAKRQNLRALRDGSLSPVDESRLAAGPTTPKGELDTVVIPARTTASPDTAKLGLQRLSAMVRTQRAPNPIPQSELDQLSAKKQACVKLRRAGAALECFREVFERALQSSLTDYPPVFLMTQLVDPRLLSHAPRHVRAAGRLEAHKGGAADTSADSQTMGDDSDVRNLDVRRSGVGRTQSPSLASHRKRKQQTLESIQGWAMRTPSTSLLSGEQAIPTGDIKPFFTAGDPSVSRYFDPASLAEGTALLITKPSESSASVDKDFQPKSPSAKTPYGSLTTVVLVDSAEVADASLTGSENVIHVTSNGSVMVTAKRSTGLAATQSSGAGKAPAAAPPRELEKRVYRPDETLLRDGPIHKQGSRHVREAVDAFKSGYNASLYVMVGPGETSSALTRMAQSPVLGYLQSMISSVVGGRETKEDSGRHSPTALSASSHNEVSSKELFVSLTQPLSPWVAVDHVRTAARARKQGEQGYTLAQQQKQPSAERRDASLPSERDGSAASQNSIEADLGDVCVPFRSAWTPAGPVVENSQYTRVMSPNQFHDLVLDAYTLMATTGRGTGSSGGNNTLLVSFLLRQGVPRGADGTSSATATTQTTTAGDGGDVTFSSLNVVLTTSCRTLETLLIPETLTMDDSKHLYLPLYRHRVVAVVDAESGGAADAIPLLDTLASLKHALSVPFFHSPWSMTVYDSYLRERAEELLTCATDLRGRESDSVTPGHGPARPGGRGTTAESPLRRPGVAQVSDVVAAYLIAQRMRSVAYDLVASRSAAAPVLSPASAESGLEETSCVLRALTASGSVYEMLQPPRPKRGTGTDLPRRGLASKGLDDIVVRRLTNIPSSFGKKGEQTGRVAAPASSLLAMARAPQAVAVATSTQPPEKLAEQTDPRGRDPQRRANPSRPTFPASPIGHGAVLARYEPVTVQASAAAGEEAVETPSLSKEPHQPLQEHTPSTPSAQVSTVPKLGFTRQTRLTTAATPAAGDGADGPPSEISLTLPYPQSPLWGGSRVVTPGAVQSFSDRTNGRRTQTTMASPPPGSSSAIRGGSGKGTTPSGDTDGSGSRSLLTQEYLRKANGTPMSREAAASDPSLVPHAFPFGWGSGALTGGAGNRRVSSTSSRIRATPPCEPDSAPCPPPAKAERPPPTKPKKTRRRLSSLIMLKPPPRPPRTTHDVCRSDDVVVSSRLPALPPKESRRLSASIESATPDLVMPSVVASHGPSATLPTLGPDGSPSRRARKHRHPHLIKTKAKDREIVQNGPLDG